MVGHSLGMVRCHKVQLPQRAWKVAIRNRRKLSHFVGPWVLTVAVVESSMASRAQRNQVGILIRAPLTAPLLVVNL